MEQTINEFQNKKEEEINEYLFLEIAPLYEFVDLFKVKAGSEEDAYELANESIGNFSSCFLITEKMLEKLKGLKLNK